MTIRVLLSTQAVQMFLWEMLKRVKWTELNWTELNCVLIFRRRKRREAGDKSTTTIANPTYEEISEKPKAPVEPNPKRSQKSENEPNAVGDYLTVTNPETDPSRPTVNTMTPTRPANPTYEEICEKPNPKPIQKSKNEPNAVGDYLTVTDPETVPRTVDTITPTRPANPTYEEICERPKPPVEPKPKRSQRSENEPNAVGDYITVADPETDSNTVDTMTTGETGPHPPYDHLQPQITPRGVYEELQQETCTRL